MGVDTNLYLGPYVSVKFEVKRVQVDYCKDHGFPGDASYCPKCGTSKASRIRTIDTIGAVDDWAENYHKGLFWNYLQNTYYLNPPKNIEEDGKTFRYYEFIPNRYWKELGLPNLSANGDPTVFDIESLDVDGQKTKFEELFKDEIAYLKQWHEVRTRFGLILYYS